MPMPPGGREENYVTVREFTKALDDIRSLYIQLDGARADTSRLRHESIGRTLERLEQGMTRLSADMDQHRTDDEAVEKRVTVVEETQKRTLWVAFAAVPSGLVAWEWLKHALKLG